tara:strand:- start:480 stop:593 length:114 start_codon:yes stop_codon:yes gene_type:complete
MINFYNFEKYFKYADAFKKLPKLNGDKNLKKIFGNNI